MTNGVIPKIERSLWLASDPRQGLQKSQRLGSANWLKRRRLCSSYLQVEQHQISLMGICVLRPHAAQGKPAVCWVIQYPGVLHCGQFDRNF